MLPGDKLGGHTLIERLTLRTSTEVWKGRSSTGDEVHLRISPIRPRTESASKNALSGGLALAQRLRHPNIIRVLDAGIQDAHQFVVTEPVDGLALDRILEAARSVGSWPSPGMAAFIVRECARALAYLHEFAEDGASLELTHRELSPAAIVVDRAGHVKISGIFSSRTPQDLLETAGREQSELTPYLSPETAANRRSDKRSDLFALGTIFWEMLAGRPLFRRATDLDTLEAVREAPIPGLPDDCPRPLAEIARKCLARAPADRFQTAADLVNALDAAIDENRDAATDSVRVLVNSVSTDSGRPRPGGTEQLSEADQGVSRPKPAGAGHPTVRSDPPSDAVRTETGRPAETREQLSKETAALFSHPRFEVLGRLGSGGMGDVYRVQDKELGDVAALKVITQTGPAEAQYLERLRREVKLARRIVSKHVCRIFDLVDLGEGRRGLMMEFIDGITLSDLLKTGLDIDEKRYAKWASDIATGLASAHSLSIIHRDLKPENIMIRSEDDSAVILDFGIARSNKSQSDDLELTQAGIIMGTPLYMSPEQLCNRPLDERSDLYALGLILAELLTGEVPLRGDSYSDILDVRAIQIQEFHMAGVNPDVAPALAQLVDRMLRPASVERPSSATLVRDFLSDFLEGKSPTLAALGPNTLPDASAQEASVAEAMLAATQPPQDQTKWWVALSLLSLLLAALVFFLLRQDSKARIIEVHPIDAAVDVPVVPPPPVAETDAGEAADSGPRDRKKRRPYRPPPAEPM